MERVRAAREAIGISQAELARRAGVSRPLVAAVEAGRQSPGVEAALALAAALGTTVEQLFALRHAAADAVVAGTGGGPVRLGRVGERPVYAEAREERWPVADAVLEDGVPLPLPGGAAHAEAVVVGCDPALGLAAALASRRVLAVAGSSGAALEALRDGRCHGALVHGPAGGLPRARPGERRVPVARWLVGLSGRRAPSLEACCERRRPVVQREPGAASQQALLRAVRALGAEPPPGPLASGHLDAARRVDLGAAQAAVTMEPAALAHGLAFTPLEEHVAELWLAPDAAGVAAVAGLCEVLGSAAFRRRLAVIGGYA